MDSVHYTSNAFASLQRDVLQFIQNKIFVGRYTEKRYVESLEAYRDIIVIDANEEIVPKLIQTKKKLGEYSHNKWIGISDDPQNPVSGDCLLWVQLSDIPIGKHWFQMTAIRFEGVEIILEIQHIQPFRSPEKSFIGDDPDFPTFNPKEIFTYQNFCEAMKFLTILTMAFFTFAVEAVRYLGEYSIKLGYVIIHFIDVSTPIWLGAFDFMAKCMWGMYWLIYVLIRGNANTPAIPGALMNQRQMGREQAYRAIEYRQRENQKSRQSFQSTQDWNNYQRQEFFK